MYEFLLSSICMTKLYILQVSHQKLNAASLVPA